MVDQNEIDKIEIVRSTNSSLVSNLQSDYRSLHARYQALVDESTIQKAQLTEALLSKDKIRNERDDLTNLVSTLQTSKPDGGSEEKEEVRPVTPLPSYQKSPVISTPSISAPPQAKFTGRQNIARNVASEEIWEPVGVTVARQLTSRPTPKPEPQKSGFSRFLSGFMK